MIGAYNMNRTESSLKNLYTAIIGQAAGILISFIARKVFLICLNEEYLGISGLFTNILTVLSLAELGVGSAMTFALYKPIADNNTEQIKALMSLYKRAYNTIGCAVLVLSVLFIPIYPHFINEIPDIPHLTLIYLLYAGNTAVSYFFTYKRTLIICDQKRYIATIYRYSFYLLLNIAQIVVLFITKNYILFCVIQLIFTIAENIAVSAAADKLYPYLKENNVETLSKETTDEIKGNIKAMMMHKIGGIVVNSTDNILLSRLCGLAAAGIYSNYYLICNALSTVYQQFFSSVSAGIGNLNAQQEDKSHLLETFYRIFFLNFWIYSFSLCCLINLFNPFITLWLGNDNLIFDEFTVSIISISFYFTGMRKTVLTFREAAGLFRPDRYKPIFESVINLAASVFLAKYLGPAGIFLGTIISTLSTCMWIEPLITFKYVFKSSVTPYFIKLAFYTAITAVICTVTSFVCSFVCISSPFAAFIVKAAICAVLPNLLLSVLFFRTNEFKYFVDLIANILKKIMHKLYRINP